MKYFSVAGSKVPVDEKNIAWWYQAGQLINIMFVNGSSIGLTFASIAEALAARTVLAEAIYKDMVSIPASSGIVYNLQCKYLRSYSLATATFTLNFPASSLTLVCDSAASALLHQHYLDNVIYSARLSRNAIGKTLVQVTTTIQAAIDSASSGNMVIIPKGYYYERLILKNGVDLYFENGSTLAYGFSTGQFHVLNGDNVSCKILGHGTFVYGSQGAGTPNALFNCSNLSNIFFEFKKLFTTREAGYVNTSAGTKVHIKGKEIIGIAFGLSNAFDSDNFELLDIDVVKITVDREYWFGYTLPSANLIARNTLFESSVAASVFNEEGIFDIMNIQLINIAAKPNANSASIVTGGDSDTNTKAFNVYFQGNSQSRSFLSPAGRTGIMTVQLYGNNYFNCNYDTVTGRVSLSGGSYVLNSSLTIYAA